MLELTLVQWAIDDRDVRGRAELGVGVLGSRVEGVREGVGLLSVAVDRGRCSWHAMLMGQEAGGGFYVCNWMLSLLHTDKAVSQ